MLNRLVRWSRIKSPWILHLNSGACNACDIEIVAALTPRFDLERFGVLLKATPRHADVIICTGPVTRQIKDRLLRIYDQVPDPKFVVAVGACAMSGCVYRGAYNVLGGIDQAIPVDAYIPGCPIRPDAVIDGVVKLLGKL
jgi:NADH-quinone oxidoreductase B subunit